MTKSLEGSPTKAKEVPSPHDIRLGPLDTNPVFHCLVIKTNTEDSVDVGLFHSFTQLVLFIQIQSNS